MATDINLKLQEDSYINLRLQNKGLDFNLDLEPEVAQKLGRELIRLAGQNALPPLAREEFERIYTEWKTATWGEDLGRLFGRLQAASNAEEKS